LRRVTTVLCNCRKATIRPLKATETALTVQIMAISWQTVMRGAHCCIAFAWLASRSQQDYLGGIRGR